MDELPTEDMGIFTEAQRVIEEVDDTTDLVTEQVKTLSAPYYTPEWDIFAVMADGQKAAWNDVNALGDLRGIAPSEIKEQLIGRQLAADFIATFKKTVLLAMQEREATIVRKKNKNGK